MAKKVVKFTNPLEALGLPQLPDPLKMLPHPDKIKEKFSQINEVVESAKEIPETLVGHFQQADEVFRSAQKSFGHTRIRK